MSINGLSESWGVKRYTLPSHAIGIGKYSIHLSLNIPIDEVDVLYCEVYFIVMQVPLFHAFCQFPAEMQSVACIFTQDSPHD